MPALRAVRLMNPNRIQGASGAFLTPFGSVALVAAAFALFGCKAGSQSAEHSGDGAVDEAAAEFTRVTVAHSIPGAQFPTVATDARSGSVYVAYIATEGTGTRQLTNVYLVARHDGETWSTPVRVNSDPGEADAQAQAPAQVEVAPNGTVIVVWTNAIPVEGRRYDASNLFMSRSTDGGRTFAPQRTINTDANGMPAGHTFHDVVISSDGTIFVSWLDSRAWHAAEAEVTAESDVVPRHMHHGMAANDSAMPGTEVRVARSLNGGVTFSEGVVAAVDVCPCCRTSLATASDGSLYVGWRHIFENGRDPAMAWSTDDGLTFSAPVRIHSDAWAIDGCPHTGPSLAFDPAGRLHVAWYTGTPTAPGLYYGTTEDGRAIDGAEPLITGVGVSQAQVVTSSDGTWIAWENQRNGSVHVSTKHSAESFTDLFVVDDSRLPAIATVRDGVIVVTQSRIGVDISEIRRDRGDVATR